MDLRHLELIESRPYSATWNESTFMQNQRNIELGTSALEQWYHLRPADNALNSTGSLLF